MAMLGRIPLAVAKFSGNLGIRTCNRHHNHPYKSYSNLVDLYVKVVDIAPTIHNLY